MEALVLKEKGAGLHYGDWPDPPPGPDEALVDLKAAALNHRDLFIVQGLYPGIRYPIILGSDGAGLHNEREVLINPSLNWGPDPRVQAQNYHILGLPTHGTFAERVSVPLDRLHPKPAHLSWAEAAALPLAGLTAFRALFTRGDLKPGERVLIHGVGGGVALVACQFALAHGAEVFVTSGSSEKIDRARAIGARGGMLYREAGWGKALMKESGGFDLIVESAGGSGFNELVNCAAPGGRIVTYGGTQGKISGLSPQKIFWKQLSILGTTMGSDADFADMLTFVAEKRIAPVIDSEWPLAEGEKGFQRMDAGKQFGKVVFRIG